MTPAELGKFLMFCALASELYFAPYISSGGRLAKEAEHYRVNAEKILREVKEKFAGKPSKAQAKLQTVCKNQDNVQKAVAELGRSGPGRSCLPSSSELARKHYDTAST